MLPNVTCLVRRQRQLIALGSRMPTLAPDTWLAPDVVVIGDVDLYDRVRALCSSIFSSFFLVLGATATAYAPTGCLRARCTVAASATKRAVAPAQLFQCA